MPAYRFIGAYPRFYPQERDAQGQSLMAELGMVVEFDGAPPSDEQWIPVDADSEVPVKTQETPAPVPAPEVPPAVPVPSQAFTEPPAATPEPAPPVEIPAPDPAPAVQVSVTPQPMHYVSPYSR